MNLINKIFKVTILLFCFLTAAFSFAQTSDFKVQHIQDDVANTGSGSTNTSFTAVSSLYNAVALANNNRKTHAGSDSYTNNLEGDDMSGARQLTTPSTLEYYRESGSRGVDMRFNSSIWEYVGATGGCNEMKVRGRFQISLNGTANSVDQGISGIVNKDNCIPFITGILNNTTRDDADSSTAIAYLDSSASMTVQKGSNANNVTVYITLVEFTGSNWTVLHGDSGDVGTDSGTINLVDGADGTGTASNVSSWSEAIIFSHFRANNDVNGVDDSLSDLWPVIDPGANNGEVDWTFHSNHVSATNTNRHFVHVLSNPFISVNRFQGTSNTAGETTIGITSAGLSDINEALIVGSSTSSGNGTAYGRGWRNYYLKSITEAAHWAHRDRNTMAHEIQIIDLSGLTSQDINVVDSGANVISDGSIDSPSATNDTEFGNVSVGTPLAKTYTIENNGSCDLTISSITSNHTDFVVSVVPASISGGSSATFTVTYIPSALGITSAEISIVNNSSVTTNQIYTFTVQGNGSDAAPYCLPKDILSQNNFYISNVSIGTINNSSTGTTGLYTFYSSVPATDIAVGDTLTGSVEVTINGWNTTTNYINIWIDFNQNDSFEDTGEIFYFSVTDPNSVAGLKTVTTAISIPIPTSALSGNTRMRLGFGDSSGWGGVTSCDFKFNSAEAEDYTVNITSFVNFEGTANDYVDFGDNHNFAAGAPFSLEAWVLQKDNTGLQTIISKGDGNAANYRGYGLFLNSGKLNLIWTDNSGNLPLNFESPYTIPINEWHHVAVTYDGTDVILYVDGIEVNSSTFNTYATQTQPFLLGAIYDSSATTTPAFNFDGYIDEVKVWDIALAVDQIREMMNQEIEQNGSEVKGKISFLDISGSLQWLNLIGYYPMDDDTLNDVSGNSINGVSINMTTNQLQNAPLPYITVADGAWNTPTTWLNNDVQYLPNTVGVDNSTSIDWNIVEISHDITSNEHIETSVLYVRNNKTFTMNGTTSSNGTGTGYGLNVSHYLLLNGTIDLEGESQLIQTEDSVLDEESEGYIERDQQGNSSSYNYNYWSSPVAPQTLSSGIPSGTPSVNLGYKLTNNLLDGTTPATPQAINFQPSYSAADSGPSSPVTISTYWLYTFNGLEGDYDSWVSIDENSSILAGDGYTMKGTSGATDVGVDFQNYTFKGKPYNGDIVIPFDNSVVEINRLIGNPYPSAIDSDEFINDNLSARNVKGDQFNGALYFWDHFGEKNSHNLGGYVGGYATRNLLGGAPAISNDSRIDDNGAAGSKIPGQYIPVGQGFFVISKSTIPISTTEITFKNSQRAFQLESYEIGSSVFMRASSSSNNDNTQDEAITNEDTQPKIRLMYDSPTGYHRQLLIGINENATNNFDIGYDAPIADINVEDMFWIIEGAKFVIQGVNNFDVDQEFPLSVIVSETGLVRIKIDALENMDNSTDLFIKDNVTGNTFQINYAPFEITLDPGEYESRFSLVFAPQEALVVDEDILSENVHIFMNNNSDELHIVNLIQAEFKSIHLYNSLGQLLDSWTDNLEDSKITLPINNKSTGIYIVQINSTKGMISKKIMIE